MKKHYDNSDQKSRIQVAFIITDGSETRMAKLHLNKEMLRDSYAEEGFGQMRARIRKGLNAEVEWAVNEVCDLLRFVNRVLPSSEKRSFWRRLFGG